MNLMRRWAANISGSWEWVLSQIENHEAVVAAALREMSQAQTTAHTQLDRVRREGETMKKRQAELTNMEVLLTERAITVAGSDQQLALDCLRQKKQITAELAALDSEISSQAQLESQLSSDLQGIEQRITELTRKKDLYSARQYRTEAAYTAKPNDLSMVNELDEIFDRWESKLGAFDAHKPQSRTADFEFDAAEQQLLQAELEQLLQTKN
jgi:phage shock protein A